MAHNGGRYQSQLGLPSFPGQYVFMNKIKMATYWSLGASGRLLASNISANGYPTSAANNPALTIDDEGGTFRSGQRVFVWEGASTFTCSGATVHAGSSLTGVSGTNRAVMNLSNDTSPKTITLTLQSTDGALNNMHWLHIDDESSYNAQKLAAPNKEPFGTKFLEVVGGLNLGVFRYLDAQLGNPSNVWHWAHRTPVSHFSYVASQFPPSLYGGTIAGTSPTMTATLSGFALTDGATVILDLPAATVISGTPTLDVSSTGAKAIKLPSGSAWAKISTGTPRRGTFIYVAILDCFICVSVYDGGGDDFDEGIMAGWPPEVMIDLCNTLSCHGHFVPPFLTCDTPSDYMPSFAALAASTLNAGLKAHWEVFPNECWNNAFRGTRHAGQVATARWAAASVDDFCGRSGSLLGAAIESAYGGDTSKYVLLGGVNTTVAPDNVAGANTLRRFESTRHVSIDGGTPAKNFITDVCPNNYWTTTKFFAGTMGTTAQQYLRMVAYVAAARDWTNGDAAAKQAAIDAQFDEASVEAWMASEADTRISRWSAVALQYGMGVIPYEGGFYPGDVGSDPTHGIDGVALGNPTVITINQINATQAHAFQAGMRARFRGIGGTTQLNGNTYDVLSVTGTTVTIDVDSTAFGTFTSGGSGTFGYSTSVTNGIIYDGYGNTGAQTLCAFTNACKASPYILYATQKSLQRCAAAGWLYPSDFFLVGFGATLSLNQWSKYDYLYSTPSPQVDAMTLFNNRWHRKRLTATS
jgi:hypothetical protein